MEDFREVEKKNGSEEPIVRESDVDHPAILRWRTTQEPKVEKISCTVSQQHESGVGIHTSGFGSLFKKDSRSRHLPPVSPFIITDSVVSRFRIEYDWRLDAFFGSLDVPSLVDRCLTGMKELKFEEMQGYKFGIPMECYMDYEHEMLMKQKDAQSSLAFLGTRFSTKTREELSDYNWLSSRG